jgi:hypothetical protein
VLAGIKHVKCGTKPSKSPWLIEPACCGACDDCNLDTTSEETAAQ